jgi:hypothetical protein
VMLRFLAHLSINAFFNEKTLDYRFDNQVFVRKKT